MEKGLVKVQIKKVAGPIEGGAAVFLGNDEKCFVIFVGIWEATAIVKELQEQQPIRPLTHDLIHRILLGFDIEVKQVIISSIVDNTFCATLILDQKILDSTGEWGGKRNEVHIDARASDSIIIALKEKKDIYVAQEVFDKVEDLSSKLDPKKEKEEKSEWESIDIPDFKLELPGYQEEEPEEVIDIPPVPPVIGNEKGSREEKDKPSRDKPRKRRKEEEKRKPEDKGEE